MKALIIKTTPIEFTGYVEVSIQKGINRHGSARIKGYIQAELEDQYIRMAMSDTPATITAEDFAGKKQTLFAGIIDNIRT